MGAWGGRSPGCVLVARGCLWTTVNHFPQWEETRMANTTQQPVVLPTSTKPGFWGHTGAQCRARMSPVRSEGFLFLVENAAPDQMASALRRKGDMRERAAL